MVNKPIHIEQQDILSALIGVSDPEIPVLSIMDMGIVRKVELHEQQLYIEITPTYSGCPAMDTIGDDIRKAMKEIGYQAKIKLVLSPAWTTDWITENGRKQLEEYGVAAPLDSITDKKVLLEGARIVKCTLCGSQNTKLVSQFGSTACKALFQCEDCMEPFDYFKCLR